MCTSLLLFVQRLLLAARYFAAYISILRFTAVKPWAFLGVLLYVVGGQHTSQVWPVLSPLFRCDSSLGFEHTQLAL